MRKFLLGFLLLLVCPLFAQNRAGIAIAGSRSSAQGSRTEASGSLCPNQGGLLSSISVPVGEPLSLSVYIYGVSSVDESFNVSVDNPAIANAGSPTQGFLGTVTVPAGSQNSNTFVLLGGSVGRANLILQSLTGHYGTSSTPVGPWDVNPTNHAFPFLDANPPGASCLVSGTANLSNDAKVLASCGVPVNGTASDGVTQLLMRTVAGIPGTMCYQITSSSTLDQGTIAGQVLQTQSGPNNYQYGFSTYQAPSYYGDISNSRTVDVLFTFTPSQGNGNTTTIPGTLTVVRPPVLLLHGLWSKAASWNSNYTRDDATHTTYAKDYSQTASSSLSTNQPFVGPAIQTVLNQFRQKQFAATQADVVAHSMGGLLTRLYVGSDNYQQPANYNMGDVHRLITLDTPHFGSSFANLLVDLYKAKPESTVDTVTSLTQGGSLIGGAVCDLAENSPALAQLSGGTMVSAQVITATGGPAGTSSSPAKYWGGATAFGINSFEGALTDTYCTQWTSTIDGAPICLNKAYVFPQTTVDAFRFRQNNDAVVGLSSEQGGLPGINFTDYIHFHIPAIPGVQRGITDGTDVTKQVFNLLDGPASGLTSALPGVSSNGSGAPLTVPGLGAASDAATYTAECATGSPLKPAAYSLLQTRSGPLFRPNLTSPLVSISSPAAGTLYLDGNTIQLVVNLSPPLTSQNTVGVTLSGFTHLTATWTSGLSFSASFTVPPGVTGPITITPDYTDTSGILHTGAPVTVGTAPVAAPLNIALAQANFVLAPNAGNQQLVVNGTYADGSVLDLTSVFTGTTYASSNSNVATVVGDGVLQVVGTGVAVITVQNGSLTLFATVLVQNPAVPLPPQVVTSQFSIQQSGFRLDRITGFFTQTVTLRNTSALPILGPLALVVGGLPAGVTLQHETGMTRTTSPGSPYLAIPLSIDGVTFAPNGTATLTLQFLNAKRTNISYNPMIVGVARLP